MRRSSVVAVLPLVAVLSCTSKDDTKVVVAVWSDLTVPAELDTVRLDVVGSSGTTSDSFPLTATGRGSLPVQLQLVPLGAKDATFTVTAVGLRAQAAIVSQTARVSFIPGKALLLKLFLGRACAGMTCPAEYTCSAGACGQPIAVPSLPPYEPGKPLLGPDAGGPVDTAPQSDGRLSDVRAADLREMEINPVDLGRNLDTPQGSGGIGGGGGTGGAGGTGGQGGTQGRDGPGGTGGGPALDAPAIDATSADALDVPLVPGDGGTDVDGGPEDGGAVPTIDTAKSDVADAISPDVGDVPLQTCVFGSSHFGSCLFGP